MVRIAILASGNGSNAQCIIERFKDSEQICVALVLSNKADAYVLKRAELEGITGMYEAPETLKDGASLLKILQAHQIDLVVLAGYLLLIPALVITQYPHRIINIHPALLPDYGGKGMYGRHVHAAVINDGQKESGITIHYVNERYDEGAIIFQARCPVLADDTPETLASRIHQLEHVHYARVVESLVVSH